MSGAGVLVGAIFGIATTDADAGAAVNIAVEGVFELNKATGAAIDQGAKVYWDVAGSQCVATGGAGKALIGVATEAAGSSAATVRVRLDAIGVTVA